MSIAVAPQRHIKIPHNNVHLQPKRTDDDFDIQILKDLVGQGLGGQELIENFQACRSKVHSAVSSILLEAHNIAEGTSDFGTVDEIFGED